ncbi:MAG TPA: M1 family metallopeptidase [Thermoanaerobaculia bacterium]|nr:M1 family metallopeptidase [Thermoanaerobaculia bacterium]
MRIIRLACVAALFTTSLLAAPLRLARDVVPSSQSITLTVDPRVDTYDGTTTIDLDVKKAVPSFNLHAEEINIRSVMIDGVAAKSAAGAENMLVITPGTPLQVGHAKMTIEFSNEFDRRAVGLYKMVRNGEPYIFSQFEAIDARKAFPVFDEPSFKIPYDLTITVPSSTTAIFNTPVVSQTQNGDTQTYVFAKTKPLPSYLLAIAVGAFELTPVPGASIPMRIVTVKGQSHLTGSAVAASPKLLAALEKYFGMPYPYEKLDLIAVPEYWYGAMENPGAITYAEGILLLDPKTAGPQQRRLQAKVTAHEMAHMWFGDYVTMAWWDDMWLNESFADWMGDKISDQVYPEYGIAANELNGVQSIMGVDASPLTPRIHNADQSAQEAMNSVGLAYNKGKAVISMFERWLGPKQFRAGVNKYLRAHAWGNAKASDFWSALGPQTAAPMETFIDQPGLPLITAEIVAPNSVKLSQTRYLRYGVKADDETWIVPIALRYSGGTGAHVKTVLLDKPSKTVTLDDVKTLKWIFPHADAAGYYRWREPKADFQALAAAATTGLTPNERIAFLGNLSALLDAGVLHGNEYLNILGRFSSESDPEVLSSLLENVDRIDRILGEDDKPLFAAYIRRTLGPALQRIGLTAKKSEPDAVTILRPQLISWLANSGKDEKVITFARERAAAYMKDPATVDPTLAGVVLTATAYNGGDAALFDEYRKRFEAATVPAERSRYLAALGAFRTPEIRERALAYVLGDKVRPTELFTIPLGMTGTDAGRTLVFDWAMKNYDVIAKRVPAQFLAGMPRLAGGCSDTRIEAARKFFLTPEHEVEGMQRSMKQVEEQVRECVAFRAREGAAVREYLAH